MKTFNKLLLCFTLVFNISAYGSDNPFHPVQELFAAMSAVDHAKMKAVVTDDFELLEVGEVWDMETLIALVKPSQYQRRNYFSIITTQIND